MKAYRIRLEHGRTDPEGICILEGQKPAISWAVLARPGARQQAYRLTVSQAKGAIWWDTGWAASAVQEATYDGPPFAPGEIYLLSISLRDEDGLAGEAAEQRFCCGAFPWRAPWIAWPEAQEEAAIRFAKDFHVQGELASACLFVCGLGYHRVSVNGRDILANPLHPAVSQYDKRCYYAVLPGLEGILAAGENRLSIEIAPGWRIPSNVCYALTNRIPEFTGPMALSATLRLRYADGRVVYVETSEDWLCAMGPITRANLFLGTTYEAARRLPGWNLPGARWPGARQAALAQGPGGRMCPDVLEPVREQEVYPALTIHAVAEDTYGVDFGQNIAGVLRLRIPAGTPAGTLIELSHAEFLDEDGRLYLAPLRKAESVDRYLAAGDDRDLAFFQPAHTYHGFRYAQIKGYPRPLRPEDVEAVSLYTDIASGSDFRCGNALVNAIHKAVVQTEKANLHSMLTDCPQRDERMAWLNDATVRFEETPYNFDVGRLFPKVVRDCLDVQGTDGAITCTAPFAFGARPADPVCASFLLAGWQAYLHTGNLDILAEGYDGFAAWNDYLLGRRDGEGVVEYSYYGDWAAPAYACQSEEHAVSGVTPGILMSTGYCYHNAMLLSKMAEALGRPQEARRQRDLADEVRAAFLRKWWDGERGVVGSGSQGCQSFALWLDILPSEGRQPAADRLHEDLVARDYAFTTGNLCTRYMMDALSRYGYLEDAFTLVTREEYPSLGFMLQNEASTIWERFELKKNPLMNSHDHPMYGAVGYWFYAYLAGIKPLTPGYRTFAVEPRVPARLLSASARVETPYGDATVRWVKRYGALHLYVDVPHGARALVTPPFGGAAETMGPGFHQWHMPL